MDAAGDVITAGSDVIPINAGGKLALIEKAMKPLSGAYRKALEASRKGNVEYANLDPLVKEQAKKYIQLGKESDKASFALGAGAPTTFSLGVANQLGKFKYQDEDKKASGGLTGYAAGGNPALQQSFINPLTERLQEFAAERYYDEEGDFNYGTALGDATILIPGLGLAGAGLRSLYGAGRALTGAVTGKGLKDKATRGLQSLFTKPGVSKKEIEAARKKAYEEARKRAVDQQKKSLGVKSTDGKQLVATGKDTLVPMGSKNLPITAGGRVFDPMKTLKTIGYPAGAAVALSRLGGEDAPVTPQELQELNTGLGGVVAEKPKKEIDYDLVGLGGLIMGSRNMSEFGKGLSEFATTASKRKIEKEALATQNELRKAQAAKYRADLKTMGFNEIQGEIQLINEAFETGALNIEDPVIQNYLMSLYEALAQRRGGSLQDDILEQQKAS